MDDDFLGRYYAAPRPDFSGKLYERIDDSMNTSVTRPPPAPANRARARTLRRWSPALALAMLALAGVLFVSFPPTRALAQDFLNLFRVKKFAAVTVDPARIQQLQNGSIDWEAMLSDNMKVSKEPGKPQLVASPAEASQRAGFAVKVPRTLPQGDFKLQSYVQGEGSVTFTADVAKAQSVLDMLGITDVQIPAGLNGAQVTVNKPPVVMLKYTSARQQLTLLQSASPEVELPPGVNLQQLGEIGLRVIGLSKDEAHAFAQNVDWTSTFLIPVPADATQVRQVDVNGASGLLLVSKSPTGPNGPNARGDSVLLWARDGMVYGLQGYSDGMDMLEVASSVQ